MTATETPRLFNHREVAVIFVLGGPGSGKGTQCARLVEDFDFCHLSAGDLLRKEQDREGSADGELIRNCIRAGQIVPMHVTIRLLQKAMLEATKRGRKGEGWQNGGARFLIDGFPRKMDQALEFDRTVCLSRVILLFETTEEVMLKRILERGKLSGREDDNEVTLRKRFASYQTDTLPVIEHYRILNKVEIVDSTGTVEKVHEDASKVVHRALRVGDYRSQDNLYN